MGWEKIPGGIPLESYLIEPGRLLYGENSDRFLRLLGPYPGHVASGKPAIDGRIDNLSSGAECPFDKAAYLPAAIVQKVDTQ